MAEPEAGQITTEQAVLLLLLDTPAELKRLEKQGVFTAASPGRYWIKDLVQGFVRHMRSTKFITDTATLATTFGLSGMRVGQLEKDGWYKRIAGTRGNFNWIEACGGYIKFLRAEDRRSTRSSADSRMKDAKARDIETRTQQRLGRLVPLDTYEDMIDTICGMVRSEFAGLAATCTRDLPMRRVIEREVNARLRRIAEAALVQAVRLETDSTPDAAIGPDGAGPVGGGKQDVSADSGSAGTA